MPKYIPSARIPTPHMLDKPWVTVALPLLQDEVAYKIHRLDQIDPLQVEVQTLWPGSDLVGPGEETKVIWLWDGDEVDSKRLTGPYDATNLPSVAGAIPSIFLAVPGLHSLQYIVELVPGNPAEPSLPIQVDLDKQAPNQGQVGNRLTFDSEIENNGVTDEYLATHADQVIGTVPPWPDIRLEDLVEVYLTLLPSRRPARPRFRVTDVVASVEIMQAHKDGAPIELVFDGDTLRSLLSNREYAVQYTLTDRAGWKGPASRSFALLIALTPSPIELRAPEVPQAFGPGANGRIDLEDAREVGGVYMNILEVAGAEAGDVLRPLWNLIALPQIVVGAFQAWPIRVAIPWATLRQGGFELAGGMVPASYTWQRGTGAVRLSQVTFVPVDLTAAGELNPDNPNFINPLLLLPTVKGVTGDDVLTIADSNQPATVELELGVGFSTNDLLELIWNADPVPVDTYVVNAGNNPGDLIPFQIPWDRIQPIGNGLVNLHYQTFNAVNRQRSRDKVVTVAVSPVVGLKLTKYPDVSYAPGADSGFIGCTLQPHPSFGVQVLVPGDDTRLQVGDVLRLSWVGYASPNGNLSHVIAGSEGEWDSPPLTLDWVHNGYPFTVPFDPHVLLPGLVKAEDYPHRPTYGSATTTYRVIRGGVAIGASNRSLVLVRLTRPNGLPPCLTPG